MLDRRRLVRAQLSRRAAEPHPTAQLPGPRCRREALIEKKMARREAAKAREDSPEVMRVTGGGDVMGGDDSFEAARARYD